MQHKQISMYSPFCNWAAHFRHHGCPFAEDFAGIWTENFLVISWGHTQKHIISLKICRSLDPSFPLKFSKITYGNAKHRLSSNISLCTIKKISPFHRLTRFTNHWMQSPSLSYIGMLIITWELKRKYGMILALLFCMPRLQLTRNFKDNIFLKDNNTYKTPRITQLSCFSRRERRIYIKLSIASQSLYL